MSNVIEFPTNKRTLRVQIESAIDTVLDNIRPEYKDAIKKEAFNAFKDNEHLFIGFKLKLPSTVTQEQLSSIQAAFDKETENKLALISQIMRLRISSYIDKIES